MFRTASIAALAAVSICAFAQTTTTTTQTPMAMPMPGNAPRVPGIYETDADLMANPPASTQTASIEDMMRNVEHQTRWINSADRYDFLNMLDKSNRNIAYLIVKGTYLARMQSDMARHDLVAQQVSASQQMAMSTQTPTIVAESDYSDVQNRPLRFVLSKPAHPEISYDTAFDVLSDSLSASETSSLRDWWMNSACDRDKDVIVHMLKKDAWIVSVPIYPSTLTSRPY